MGAGLKVRTSSCFKGMLQLLMLTTASEYFHKPSCIAYAARKSESQKTSRLQVTANNAICNHASGDSSATSSTEENEATDNSVLQGATGNAIASHASRESSAASTPPRGRRSRRPIHEGMIVAFRGQPHLLFQIHAILSGDSNNYRECPTKRKHPLQMHRKAVHKAQLNSKGAMAALRYPPDC